jgi:hypothetical protein
MSTETRTADTITWHESLETYLRATGEKAHGLSWLHKKAEDLYTHRRTLIDLPVVVVGAINGFVSVGSAQIFQGWAYGSIVVGLISLLVSVLNTTGSYFGWAKRAEGHRLSAIHYAKLYRYIVVELALPREERQPPSAVLKNTQDQYDRLQEVSPLIPGHVLQEFKTRFSKVSDIAQPEEANGLEKITVYANPLAAP